MDDKDKRIKFLKKFYSEKIMKVFKEEIAEDGFYKEPISYGEAVEVLNHTISVLSEKPILF